jgi:hypothetical protein
MAAYLLPIADRAPLGWIVRSQQTAFAEHRARDAARLQEGDRLFLYTTRGCFRNPTRDRGRVIGVASVVAPAREERPAVEFGGVEYPHAVDLRIEKLAPLREGVELAPLVPRLRETFPDPRTWSVRMRRALVPLAEDDAALLEREVDGAAAEYPAALGSYDGVASRS